MKKRVCVIGAGASGLVALKELVAEGHEVACFEKASSFGGAFAGPGVEANRVYESLYLTISNYYMAFSDFPPRGDWKFWTGAEYLEYMQSYAQEFDLLRHVTFSTAVTQVVEGKESKWEVTTQGADGHKETRSFDAVAVCCGTHQVPKRPAFEGAESFEGDIDHSYQFWNASKYAGKNVAVVGMGESSADVVRDISDVSASCHLVLRSYPMCVPRLLPDGHPADSMTSRLFYPNRTDSLLVWGLAAIIAFVLWAPLVLLGFVKEHLKWPYLKDAFGQTKETYMDVRTKRTNELVALMAKMHGEQNLSFCNKFATKNVSWIPNVVDGKIKMQLGKVQRLGPRSLTLEDGSTLNDLDAIVFCTGYKDEFAFLPQHIAPADNDVRRLYLHAFNPTVGSSMAFIGFSRPTTGAIPACSELVARYFALLVSGKRSLPKDVAARAVANWKAEDKLMYNSLSVRSCVNPCEYMDDVAEQIGCVPSPWMYWYNPLKFLDHLVALNCVARFRLVGPHAKPLMAKKWLDKIPITAPLPAVLILMVNKVLFCLGLSTGDIMIDLRKWNVEATWVLAIAQPRGF